jgi:hypothetical protein
VPWPSGVSCTCVCVPPEDPHPPLFLAFCRVAAMTFSSHSEISPPSWQGADWRSTIISCFKFPRTVECVGSFTKDHAKGVGWQAAWVRASSSLSAQESICEYMQHFSNQARTSAAVVPLPCARLEVFPRNAAAVATQHRRLDLAP